jgi:SAM-dependent methyltransferase
MQRSRNGFEPVANPLTFYDRLYLRLFYFLRSLRYDLPENRVGWRSRQNQELRFQALMGIGDLQGKSILDLGCGLGCLYGFLKGRGWEGEYTGIDILDIMVKDARRRFPGVAFEKRDILDAPPARKWDYIFINGVLNHKVKDNWAWIERMVKAAYSLAEGGVGFNLLNADVEGEWGDRDLFYADPKVLQEKVGQWSGGNYRIVTGYMPEDITAYMLHQPLQVDPKPQVSVQG